MPLIEINQNRLGKRNDPAGISDGRVARSVCRIPLYATRPMTWWIRRSITCSPRTASFRNT